MIVSEVPRYTDEMSTSFHYPVMYREVLEFLEPADKKIVVDCTVGVGSQAEKLLEVMAPGSRLIGIDRDKQSLDIAESRLVRFKGKFTLVKEDFANLAKVLSSLNLSGADAFLFDLGISAYQLNDPQRGFSFLKNGPLDMRMDQDFFLSAYDLVNNLSERELENIFRKFGEERYSRRAAHFLVEARRKEPLYTTTQVAQIIIRAVPFHSRRDKIHPATRIFQALRIAVNRELEALEKGISEAVSLLNQQGRIAVISFHSLEDRIAKRRLKDFSAAGVLNIITRKPLLPTDAERGENISSRSAKFRVAEKKIIRS